MKTFERLETFLTLAECGSFTETAKRLYCSQPTISGHIQQLEELLDAKLLVRSGRTVKLTPQGEIFYDYARRITQMFKEAADKIAQSQQTEPVLSIYASNYIGVYVLPDLLGQFRHSNPKQRFELHTYGYDDLHRMLAQHQIHLAFMPLYDDDSYIQSELDHYVLFEDQFLLVFPPDHPWSERKTLYARDLEHTTLLLPQSRLLQSSILAPLEKLRIRLSTVPMSSFEVIKESVKNGLGIAFLPVYAVRDQLDKGALLTKPVCGLRIERKNGLVYRRDIQLTDAEQAFYDCVKNVYTEEKLPASLS
ncbi:LysR family transcriptional regulator [Paenibacillus doosanensis]|uniref:HTH-type transcriptional regulator CysL n=1 Tax=Paenibacillus konkukensis TaxID=2020716 RepID=A0ABY4RQK9_9BACL|nr:MULTISPECIES: LysR family transcriptional regulator [Paenibacillus]MCS7459224.1 LysR family transcriptional regulator [Paenibacillus doosanensis]UQZ84275.1 HTH-type transcriptional regulator CysL [Paenibacillus konkukensis]